MFRLHAAFDIDFFPLANQTSRSFYSDTFIPEYSLWLSSRFNKPTLIVLRTFKEELHLAPSPSTSSIVVTNVRKTARQATTRKTFVCDFRIAQDTTRDQRNRGFKTLLSLCVLLYTNGHFRFRTTPWECSSRTFARFRNFACENGGWIGEKWETQFSGFWPPGVRYSTPSLSRFCLNFLRLMKAPYMSPGEKRTCTSVANPSFVTSRGMRGSACLNF